MERETRRKNTASRETDRTHHLPSSEPVFEDYSEGGDDVSDALIRVSNASKDQNYPDKAFEYHLSTISVREIHFSILSSERSRVVCSLVIAVLVVLSHINLPHKVIKSKSLIAYRPLYAVLLSDMLIIGARLALYSQGKEEEEGGEVKIEKDVVNWDGAVTLLEWGLMMHQALRAVFIDCSLYLAVVICGLSLV
ncbi:hypothetical protein ACS0TY_035088 [Phlomoides rotata]